MSSAEITVPGLRNLGNTCFLNAVLQALASSHATVEHLLQQPSQASEAEQPLATAVLDCLYNLRCQEVSLHRCSVSPKSVLKAVREYVSAECLVDGQQNDSAEVLEVLCSALAKEEQETKLSVHRYIVTQLPWRTLQSMVGSDLGVRNCLSGSQTAHNTVHQDARVVDKQALLCSDKLNNHVSDGSSSVSSSSDSSSSDSASSSSTSEEEAVADAASTSGRRWPLEGNTVNDMMCITCQHCFVSQHSPFCVLPLALPTTRMSQRVHGKLQMPRTVVARNTSLLQCLAALCLPEVIHGVHCPRCTLRAAVASWKNKEDVQGSPCSKPTAATAATSATAATPGEAEEVASLSGTAQAAVPTAVRTPLAQSEAAPSSVTATTDDAGAPVLFKEKAQLHGGTAKALDGTAEEAASSEEMQDDKVVIAAAVDQAAALSAAAAEVHNIERVAAAFAETSSASHTAAAAATTAAAAKEAPTGAQMHSRGIIEGLLRSRAPWPDMDYEQLINHAGLKWSPVGSMCMKRIALGQAPQVLCLHMRRAFWTNTGRHIKLSGQVRFPLTLSVAPYSAACLPALSSLSQQYVPDAAQSCWMRSAGTAAGGGGGGDGGGAGSNSGGEVDVTLPAADIAMPTVHLERSMERNGSGGQAEASTGAQNATALFGKPTESGAQTSASTGDKNANDGSINLSSGDAPAEAKGTARPQCSDPPATSSPFASAEAGKAADEGDQSTTAGHVAVPGPVKRLLASHALSLASSLTSESSLLSDQAFAQDTANDSQHSANLASTAAAVDESAARPSQENSGWVQQGKSPKSPMQRVLASHPLSLASCLSSETSMSANVMFDDTASPSMVSGPGQSLMSKAPLPSCSIVHDAKQGSLNRGAVKISEEAIAAGTVGSVSRADAEIDKATSDGNKASQANTGVSDGSCSSLLLDTVAQEGDCSTAIPSPTEPLTINDDSIAHQKNATTGQDIFKKQYRLVAAVVHHGGGSSSGHYTVYRCVRLEGQQKDSAHSYWFSISDESVHKVDVREVLECEATLLMYEQ